MLELFLVWEVQLFYHHSNLHLDGKHLYYYYHLGNYAPINQIMLKIIFGNIVRKDYYYLNKSNIYLKKKIGIESCGKDFYFSFLQKNLRLVRSGWTRE